MSFNESTAEDTTLEWYGALGYAVEQGPHLTPGEAAAERDSLGEAEVRRMYKNQAGILEP